MTVPALRPLALGELLDASFLVFRRLFGPLLQVQVVCGLPVLVIGVYAAASGRESFGLQVLQLLIQLITGTFASGATALLVGAAYTGRPVEPRRALRAVGERFQAVFAAGLLAGLLAGLAAIPPLGLLGLAATAFGSTFVGVPMPLVGTGLLVSGLVALALPLWIFAGTSFASLAVMLEQLPTGRAGLARSWRLSRGARGRLAVLLFGVLLAIGIVFAGLGFVAAMLPEAVTALLQAIASFALTPLFACVVTLAYYDRRVRTEGFDLELLAADLDTAPTA